jgi:hypothetical protein
VTSFSSNITHHVNKLNSRRPERLQERRRRAMAIQTSASATPRSARSTATGLRVSASRSGVFSALPSLKWSGGDERGENGSEVVAGESVRVE